MKAKSSINKLVVSIVVVSALLLTVFTAQAASPKTTPAAAGSALSALSVEKVTSSLPKLFSQVLNLSAGKNETSASDDKGGQAAELKPGTDESSVAGENTENEAENENEKELTGTVTAASSSSWTVGKTEFMIDSSTKIETGLGVGSVVEVEFQTESNGSFLATEIQAEDKDSTGDEMSKDENTSGSSENSHESEDGSENSNAQMGNRVVLFGQLTAVNGDTWTVNGKTVLVTTSTRIKDNPKVGNMVMVVGTLESNKSIQADQVKLFTSERKSSHDESGSPFSGSNGNGDQHQDSHRSGGGD